MNKTDILSLTLPELTEALAEAGEPKFRSKQLYEWLHKKRAVSFSECTNLSKKLIEYLDERYYIPALEIKRKLVSAIDGTVKYLYAFPDGEKVETVMMSYKHGSSLCISTQVGCKMGCSFCASTKAGFVRNLAPSEMLLQIYESEKDSGRKVESLVLMGIGEPLDNYDNVIKFLRLLTAKEGLNVSARNISLSTCGLVPKMYRLAEEWIPLNLTVSLHATEDSERQKIMPAAKAYKIADILKACANYFNKTGRRYYFEYTLIDGKNSDEAHAEALSALLKGKPCHVNLIRLNEVKERSLKSASDKNAYRFMGVLQKNGISATLRRQIGADIGGACGQLRAAYVAENNKNEAQSGDKR